MTEAERALSRLLDLMATLRDPVRGCPWDLEQTFETIAPYTIEEAYEVADAIERGSPAKICDELGDLLFQVTFHARMAEERGWFDFAAVARAIHDKLVRRHPHVFPPPPDASATAIGLANAKGITTAEFLRTWEQMKAEERAAAAASGSDTGAGTLDDVPRALPALLRAAKLGKRASRVGFDWPDVQGVREKVLEEIREVDEAGADASRVTEEIGDLLFAVVNWSRHLKVDPEDALRAANSKFEKRFRGMEAVAAAQGQDLQKLTAEEWEALWQRAKATEA